MLLHFKNSLTLAKLLLSLAFIYPDPPKKIKRNKFFFSLSIKEKRYSAVNTIPRGIVFDSYYSLAHHIATVINASVIAIAQRGYQ